MAVNLVGGKDSDYLVGNDGVNTIWGGGPPAYVSPNGYVDYGNDTIFGLGGNDIINGWAGDDTIWGGAGADFLGGHTGADTFAYANASESRVGSMDYIADFNFFEGDRINVSAAGALNLTLDYSVSSYETYISSNVDASGYAFYIRATSQVIPQALMVAPGSTFTIIASTLGGTLLGSAGADVIFGNVGSDYIIGAGGGDIIAPGAGSDVIAYQSAGDSSFFDYDEINGFQSGQDIINLSGFGLAIGSTLNWTYDAANNWTVVFADTDHNSVYDMRIILIGTSTLTPTDFFL